MVGAVIGETVGMPGEDAQVFQGLVAGAGVIGTVIWGVGKVAGFGGGNIGGIKVDLVGVIVMGSKFPGTATMASMRVIGKTLL